MPARILTLLAVLTAVMASSCGASDRDRYSYDGVDDKTALSLNLQNQELLRDSRALGGQEWDVFVRETTTRICESLDQGQTFDSMVNFASKNFAVTDARQFVGNAVGYLCPQHLDRS
jgi:hypothetical protein